MNTAIENAIRHQASTKRLRVVIIGLLLLGVSFIAAAEGMAEMGKNADLAGTLPAELLRQTFKVRTAAGTGTAFTIEVDDRQYIVTAQHVLGSSPVMLEMQVSNTVWKPVPVTIIDMAGPPVDVAVLATDSMLGSRSSVPVGIGTVGYGQEVRFLGYPYDFEFVAVPEFRHAPLPLVKAGILSAIGEDGAGVFHLLVDAAVNHGFSGGPLVLPRRSEDGSIDWHIAGVVTGGYERRVPVKNESGSVIGWTTVDIGILHAISIDAVRRMIKGNPAGYPLPD